MVAVDGSRVAAKSPGATTRKWLRNFASVVEAHLPPAVIVWVMVCFLGGVRKNSANLFSESPANHTCDAALSPRRRRPRSVYIRNRSARRRAARRRPRSKRRRPKPARLQMVGRREDREELLLRRKICVSSSSLKLPRSSATRIIKCPADAIVYLVARFAHLATRTWRGAQLDYLHLHAGGS